MIMLKTKPVLCDKNTYILKCTLLFQTCKFVSLLKAIVYLLPHLGVGINLNYIYNNI